LSIKQAALTTRLVSMCQSKYCGLKERHTAALLTPLSSAAIICSSFSPSTAHGRPPRFPRRAAAANVDALDDEGAKVQKLQANSRNLALFGRSAPAVVA